MKKFGLLAALFVLMLSCTIEDTPDTSWKVINVEIRSSDWVADTDDDGINLYYSCRVNMPELSSFIYQNGMVQAYYKTTDYQQQLPYVRHYENLAGDLWTRTIDYDYEVGYMNFYVTNSDFVIKRPETMKFRIVLLW